MPCEILYVSYSKEIAERTTRDFRHKTFRLPSNFKQQKQFISKEEFRNLDLIRKPLQFRISTRIS